ncbi:MAG TPA: DUF2953 domain-containing protein, partial [Mobilitalea sp.]|nr:DUF2953 domain-containing protein [Mobilitalea sp.]
MLHIIFLILKIIGIILLSVLCLLVALILIVLLVPIRYKIEAEHGEHLKVEGRISWLAHIVHANIAVQDGVNRILLRIFGFVIFDSLRPAKEKPKKDRNSIKKSRIRKKSKKNKRKNRNTANHNKNSIEEAIDKKEALEDGRSYELNIDQETVKTDEDKQEEQNEQKESRLQKILHKIKSIYQSILNFFHRLRDKIKAFLKKALGIKHKINLVKEFVSEEINREGLKVALSSIVKLFKHIFPTRLKLRLTFGTGDPCSTGQALGAFSILYGFYGDNISITPDFENKVFEGKHYAKGRIRIGSLLIIV